MVSKIKYLINTLNYQPSWLIFLIDGFFSCAAALMVCLLFTGISDFSHMYVYIPGILKFLVAGIISTLFTKSYRGVIRHTSFEDIVSLLKTLTLQLALLFMYESVGVITGATPKAIVGFYCISSLTCLFLFFNYRMAVRYIFFFSKRTAVGPVKTAIFGAGESGVLLLNYLKNDQKSKISVLMFFDDEITKSNKFINGIPVMDARMLDYFSKKFGIQQIIVSPRIISNRRKEELFEISNKLGVQLKVIPTDDLWFTGTKAAPEKMHDIEILDLLGREQIATDNTQIKELLTGERVLVTGAAGSIGSELCRQIIRENPAELFILDQAESPLYEIAIELRNINPDVKLTSFLCDVGNEKRLEQVFKENKIKILFHAAAYKHVPMQEQHPYEAVYCNVKGTFSLANLAVKHGIEKFIMVSTDKAVNPTNIMGATKRAAEIYTQSLNFGIRVNNTQFITTRFGNVLGSNGSVVPLFKRQIAEGGPVTLTHPEITRYFMTISEASTLVLEAAAMGNGGEIFVFDMGTPIKIKDLAEKMIMLSGKDVPIKYTGLREGEKLYEELLANGENTRPTYNKKIMIAKVRQYDYAEVLKRFNDIFYYMEEMDEMGMVASLKLLVPEFISNQSRFCSLDRERVHALPAKEESELSYRITA